MARNPAVPRFGRKVRQVDEQLRDLRLRQPGSLPRARFSLPVAGQSFLGRHVVTGGFTSNNYQRLDLSQTELAEVATWDSDLSGGEPHALIGVSAWYRCVAHAELRLISDGTHSLYEPPDVFLDAGLWVQFTYPGESFEDEFANLIDNQTQTRTDQIHAWATHNHGLETTLNGVMYLEAGQKVWFGLLLGTSGSSADFYVSGGPPVAEDNFSYASRDPYGMAYLDLALIG